MKICTITCHDVYNQGASLQAYALMSYLKKLGHEVEIINYKPKYLDIDYIFFAINSPRWKKHLLLKIVYLLLKIPERLGELPTKHGFDAFRRSCMTLTAKRYGSNEELRSDPPKADAYICGSDQIWNCNIPNGRDPAFYLDFAPSSAITLSYAASFAMDHIPEDIKDELRRRIDKLQYISVREIDAVRMLHELGIDRAMHVLDPVFLLEKSEWEEMAEPAPKGRYILIFCFDNENIGLGIAKKIAAIKNCPIYAANSAPLRGADRNLGFASPREFLGLIRNAQYVVTNSFHAVAFATIFNVEFLAFGRTEKMNSRITGLLRSLELQERYLPGTDFDPRKLPSVNYPEAGKRIEAMKERSKRFLENALHNSVNI